MAKYHTLPNYEIIRPKLYIQFDSSGNYETNDETLIDYLDGCAPFIERVDKPKDDPKVESPKPVTKRTNATTKK